MKFYILLVACALSSGCVKKSELDNAQNKSKEIEKKLVEQVATNASFRAQIQLLTTGVANANAKIASLTSQLSDATNALHQQSMEIDKYRNYFKQKKETAAAAASAAEIRRKEMLKQVAEANRPADWPYRAFDIFLVGLQDRDGVKAEYGRFSIRNYTDQTLNGVASSGIGYSEKFDVPPNSERRDIYIRANKGTKLNIDCNLGDKTYDWAIGWQ